MNKNNKSNHGGKREGSGRKKIDGTDKKNLTLWMDAELIERIKQEHGRKLSRVIEDLIRDNIDIM